MSGLVVFGLGYTGTRLLASGQGATGFGRDADPAAVRAALAAASHVVSTVPPGAAGDPILTVYGGALAGRWLGYLSSTGVYGDTGGAWVDESAAITGRRAERNAADAAWLARGARVFRLPGIYGPGRSPVDRVRTGQAHRTGIADQVFSRVHVDDLVAGVLAGFDAPAGAYNLADDLPAPQDAVIEYAAALAGVPPPPLVALDALSPAARAYYAENRRVANGRAKRVLGWRPRYPDYRAGLRAVSATTSPATASADPTTASTDQR